MTSTPTMQRELPENVRRVIDRLDPLNNAEAIALICEMAAKLNPAAVAVDLEKNTIVRGGLTVRLSPNQAVIMSQMANAFPKTISVPEMHRALWGGARAERSVNTIRVMMTDLRKILAPLHVTIQNQNGVGYRLDLQSIT